MDPTDTDPAKLTIKYRWSDKDNSSSTKKTIPFSFNSLVYRLQPCVVLRFIDTSQYLTLFSCYITFSGLGFTSKFSKVPDDWPYNSAAFKRS